MEIDPSDSSFFNHKSVMTDEIMASLEHYPLINHNQLKGIDATLGGGGHSYHLLKKYSDLNIIGLDQDPFARKSASKKLDEFKNRIDIRNGCPISASSFLKSIKLSLQNCHCLSE